MSYETFVASKLAAHDDLLVLIPHLTAAYEHEITRRPWAAHIIQSHIDRLNGAE
jgi:hypothetical protein